MTDLNVKSMIQVFKNEWEKVKQKNPIIEFGKIKFSLFVEDIENNDKFKLHMYSLYIEGYSKSYTDNYFEFSSDSDGNAKFGWVLHLIDDPDMFDKKYWDINKDNAANIIEEAVKDFSEHLVKQLLLTDVSKLAS